MSKKQFYILEATLVAILVLLLINTVFNVRSSSSEAPTYTAEQTDNQEPIEQIKKTVVSLDKEETVTNSSLDSIILKANLAISNDIATVMCHTDESGAEEVISCNIPKPIEVQDLISSMDTFYIESERYNIFPYIDTNSNLVNLLVTLDSNSKPSIDFKIIDSNVKKIIPIENPSTRMVYQTKTGNYKFAFMSDTEERIEVIDLNEQTVPEFYIFYYEHVTYENVLLHGSEIDYEILGYGEFSHTFYEFEKPIIWNKDSYNVLHPLLEGKFRACEFEELYEKLVQAVNKINLMQETS